MNFWSFKTSIFIYIFFSQIVLSQTAINVIQSNNLEQIVVNQSIFQKFSGNVIIEYSDLKINCDTVIISENKQKIQAWGGVKIYNDTLTCNSDSININRLNNKMTFYENSQVTTKTMTIISDNINYNYKKDYLKYSNGGTVTTDDYQISSEVFKYNFEKQISEFYNKIYLFNNKHIINGDSLIYNQKEATLMMTHNINITYDDRIITAKYLNRDIQKNENQFYKNIHINIDKNRNIFGEKLIQKNEISTMTENCQIHLKNENQLTIIEGDTISIKKNDDLEVKNNVIIKGTEIKGICQKMTFHSEYSEIIMFNSPVLWLNNTQIHGDRINLFSVKNQLDSIYIPSNPFITIAVDSSDFYHQIKGKYLTGRFTNNKINYIDLIGNGEMKYFNRTNDIVGINNIKTSSIKLLFKENQLEKIICYDQIDSDYQEIKENEIQKGKKDVIYIDGFQLKEKKPF